MTGKITHALISVSDKEGIVDFAKDLISANISILSTGGTAQLLKNQHIPVTDVAEFTGFPEIMGGRVKTLHPRLYGGILARGEIDKEVLRQYDIPSLGLVVVNLYPFEETIADKNCQLEDAIEQIDIGGPTLLRAAAKNYHHTTVVIDKEDYASVLAEIQDHGNTTEETRLNLAKKVFAHVANYDAAISHYFALLGQDQDDLFFPDRYTLTLAKKTDLRYGENPHQKAAFYLLPDRKHGICQATQHSGKPLSYNNIADADAALECVSQFSEVACVIVKHANPCAVALANSQLQAYEKAFHADATSAFGGIIAFNRELAEDTIANILANQFVEVIVAPSATPSAIEIVKQKPNVRLLTVGSLKQPHASQWEFKSVSGGMLIQEKDNLPSPPALEVVTARKPSADELEDLHFAWQVVRFVKSNAIVFAKDGLTLGIGPGQMSRVFSSKIAALKAADAGFSLKGAVMASDAFFPFKDSIEEAAELGIAAIIQPGGSLRDEEVIATANEFNLTMVFTHRRHFKH